MITRTVRNTKNYGYQIPKPLIKINKDPMFIKAAKSFPTYFKWLFVANKNLKNENTESSKQYLLLTIILGVLFFVTQFLGWKSLVNDGYFFVGSSNASSYVYVFSGLHLAHLIFGLFFLLQSYIKMTVKYFSMEKNLVFKIKNWFWHFLGFLWIYLYCFLAILN